MGHPSRGLRLSMRVSSLGDELTQPFTSSRTKRKAEELDVHGLRPTVYVISNQTKSQRNWTGAPRSPQRTWAEKEFFVECFYTMSRNC